MRRTAAAMALILGLTASRPAFAGKCYVDSDCPTGMVCNAEGGCVVPGGSTGGSTSRGASGAKLVVYALVLGVVIVAILVPAMRATDEANGARAGLDERQLRQRMPEPAPTCGLTMRF